MKWEVRKTAMIICIAVATRYSVIYAENINEPVKISNSIQDIGLSDSAIVVEDCNVSDGAIQISTEVTTETSTEASTETTTAMSTETTTEVTTVKSDNNSGGGNSGNNNSEATTVITTENSTEVTTSAIVNSSVSGAAIIANSKNESINNADVILGEEASDTEVITEIEQIDEIGEIISEIVTSGEVTTEEITEIPTEETTETTTSEGTTETTEQSTETTTEETTETTTEESAVLKVSMPLKVNATLDPNNLAGRGQIYSDRYTISNYSNCDVLIKIKSFKPMPADVEYLEDLTNEAVYGDDKKINIVMKWYSNGEEKVIPIDSDVENESVFVLKASKYDDKGEWVSFDEGSCIYFEYGGTLNTEKINLFNGSDLRIDVAYSLEEYLPEPEKTESEETDASVDGKAITQAQEVILKTEKEEDEE